ncbi:hypothetical protein BN59_02950 [Legionella massiliensis]|uniref:Glycosyltransferase RgtA/B/C/D-like domain-containing protein n=1 Tax=Legionella massiliensis TaxID=1034943 RepID=A0A078L3W7_9GAMM|nr:glycosyltransferase family 39 protein [Legionella massiliensis]CDZ78638.1 hypothetical protein BN59_02950 [Legionella massiliensis]CEE14376.1 hypothetical protein BN1094_02950 [Legionella massiliensis]
MTYKTKLAQQSWLEHPGIILFLFAFLILLFRIFLRGQMLELDEAEQVVMAQQLLPGYPDQPPLYTWLQYTFFHIFGCSLLSLALLKSILLFGCLYTFHQISRLHCKTLSLAWCATLAWALIPAISLDLIKDNTHSVLALFTACLSWYWFIAPSRLTKLSWYLILGCIIGIGFLSKFNYLLFFAILFISAVSIAEFRAKLLSPYLLLTLFVSLLIASPYIFWLEHHFGLGFRSVYKLTPEDKQPWYGFAELIMAIIFFIVPNFLVARIFFPFKFRLGQQFSANTLLYRYHLISIPFLIVVLLFAAIKNFETRWLIPILFLSPLLFFGQVKEEEALAKRVKSFLRVCILVQCCLFIALFYRSHSGHKIRNQFPYQQLVQVIKNNEQQLKFIVSDSHWLIGNLMLNFPNLQGWLLHPATQPVLPQGKAILIWQAPVPPFWVDLFAQTNHLTKIQFIEDPQSHQAVAGYTFTKT